MPDLAFNPKASSHSLFAYLSAAPPRELVPSRIGEGRASPSTHSFARPRDSAGPTPSPTRRHGPPPRRATCVGPAGTVAERGCRGREAGAGGGRPSERRGAGAAADPAPSPAPVRQERPPREPSIPSQAPTPRRCRRAPAPTLGDGASDSAGRLGRDTALLSWMSCSAETLG